MGCGDIGERGVYGNPRLGVGRSSEEQENNWFHGQIVSLSEQGRVAESLKRNISISSSLTAWVGAPVAVPKQECGHRRTWR